MKIQSHSKIILLFIFQYFHFNGTELKAQQTADSTAADSLLLKAVAWQMQSAEQTPATATQRSGLSFNPDIGVIGDFRGSYTNVGEKNFDAWLNETEMSLQAVVDPYARADVFLSFGRNPETLEYGVEVEEAYLTTLSLPAKLQLKVGKFREAIGKINPLHPHALPFIDMPNAFVNLFGEEGLNDEGASLSWLLPNKKFYQEIIFQATGGYSETPSFMRSQGNQFVYLGHLKNFFTISGNSTLEFGISAVTGPNDSSLNTTISAVDLTYKWKPLKLNTYHSLTWQSEFFYTNKNMTENVNEKSFGLYSFLEYQIAKRWFLTGRFDYGEKPYDKSIRENAYSLTAGWLATEFQKIEFEVKMTDDNTQDHYYQAWLRWIFVIGAHGAHQY